MLALHADGLAERLLEPFAPFLHPNALQTVRELVPPLEWSADPLKREPYCG
ncbi:MAG TPA: hypothetical protein VKU00_33440 [Chthonomonadaceae bacterium]|nr:hypothetical protein [Chthonomonadaceae bacterium]